MNKHIKKPSCYAKMDEKWPSTVVARSAIAKFTGGLYSSGYMRTLDCLGQGPKKRYTVGGKVVYDKEALIEWLNDRTCPVSGGSYSFWLGEADQLKASLIGVEERKDRVEVWVEMDGAYIRYDVFPDQVTEIEKHLVNEYMSYEHFSAAMKKHHPHTKFTPEPVLVHLMFNDLQASVEEMLSEKKLQQS
jgi:hypothetical protein